MEQKPVKKVEGPFNSQQQVTVYGTGKGRIKLGRSFNTTGAIANGLIKKGEATTENPN